MLGGLAVHNDSDRESQNDRRVSAVGAPLDDDRFKQVVEFAPNAIVMVDEQGTIVLVNAQTEKLFGYDRNELVGQAVEMLVPNRFRGAHPQNRIHFLATPTARPMGAGRELYGLRRDGTEFPIEIGLNPLETRQGLMILSAIVDITERRRAESRFRQVVEFSPSAMVMVDQQGTMVLVNAQAERLFGYSRSELIGQPIEMLVPERFRGPHPSYRRAFSVDANPRAMGENLELYALRKDGSEVPVEIGLNPIDAFEGPMVLSAINDITERKLAETASREADRRKDEFLAMLAHELRNPLAPITTAMELFRRLLPADARLHELREMTQRQVKHLTRLVDDLLDVSRLTSGKVRLRRERIDLKEVVEHAVHMCQPSIKAKAHRLIVEWIHETPWVDGDAVRLSQVVGNLLSNAVNYTPNGGLIRVSVERDPPYVVLRVRDNGIGIASQHLKDVFDLFRQIEPGADRKDGGLGIGLTLVKSLVELHGGSVEARSQGLGFGSEFSVRLPLAATHYHSASPEPEAPSGHPTRRRILVVDDNVDAADSLASLLESFGHEARVAYSGPDAIAAAMEFQPEVAIIDIVLTDLDGYEVASALRRNQGQKPLVLIALSGYRQQEEPRHHARNFLFNHRLLKPLDLGALQAILT